MKSNCDVTSLLLFLFLSFHCHESSRCFTILSIFNKFSFSDLTAAKLTLAILLVKEDNAVCVRDVGQLELLAVLGVDDGHSE